MQAGVIMVSQRRDANWPESIFKALHSHCGLKKVQAFCHLACSWPYVWSEANCISQEALQDGPVFAVLLQGRKAQLHSGAWLVHTCSATPFLTSISTVGAPPLLLSQRSLLALKQLRICAWQSHAEP